tara:strand:+ start:186 stop:332 length:147 start_codon:yes stop_codon:yes gene_type:complete
MKLIESILRTAGAVIILAAIVYLLDKFGLVEFIVDKVDFVLEKLRKLK